MPTTGDKFSWSLRDIEIVQPEAASGPDPRLPRYKRLLTKTTFAGDEALYAEFLELYDAEVVRGSKIPFEAAMIEFRKKYIDRADGTWVKR